MQRTTTSKPSKGQPSNMAPSSSSSSSSSPPFAPPPRSSVQPVLKRPRLGSAVPSRAGSTSSFSAADPAHELHAARMDSSQRLMSVWSQLADRYARPLADDDIVDLRTKSIIQDRGTIRAAAGNIDFGSLTAAPESGTPDGEDDESEDVDELDMLAAEADISGELAVRGPNVPPVQAMDPADAADLNEFLRLEQQRREQFGDLDDEDAEGAVFHPSKAKGPLTPRTRSPSHSIPARDRSMSRPRPLPRPSLPPQLSSDTESSDDELSRWDTVDKTYKRTVEDREEMDQPSSSDFASDNHLPPPSSSPPRPSSPASSDIIDRTPVRPHKDDERRSYRSPRKTALVGKAVSSPVSPTDDELRAESPELDIVPPRSSPLKVRSRTTRPGSPSPSPPLVLSPPAPPRRRNMSRILQLHTPPRSSSSASFATDGTSDTGVSAEARPRAERSSFRAGPTRNLSPGSRGSSARDTIEHENGRASRLRDRPAATILASAEAHFKSKQPISVSALRLPSPEPSSPLSSGDRSPKRGRGRPASSPLPVARRRSQATRDTKPEVLRLDNVSSSDVSANQRGDTRPRARAASSSSHGDSSLSPSPEPPPKNSLRKRKRRSYSDGERERSPVQADVSCVHSRLPGPSRARSRSRAEATHARRDLSPNANSASESSARLNRRPTSSSDFAVRLGDIVPEPRHAPEALPRAPDIHPTGLYSPPMHDSHAQFVWAQTMQGIQYLMNLMPRTPLAQPFPTNPHAFAPVPTHLPLYGTQHNERGGQFPFALSRSASDLAHSSSANNSHSAHRHPPALKHSSSYSSLPPSSPPLPSSPERELGYPPLHATSRSRSRARSRRVSFHVDEEHIYEGHTRVVTSLPDEDDAIQERGSLHRATPAPSSMGRAHARSLPRDTSTRKSREFVISSDSEESAVIARGRSVDRGRARTPGPSSLRRAATALEASSRPSRR